MVTLFAMGILLSWLVLSMAFWVTAQLLPGFQISGVKGAILGAAIFGLLNALIGWLLAGVVIVATLGIGWLLPFITRWFVNAILLKIVDGFTDKLTIKNFGTAFVAGLIIATIGSIGEYLLIARP
jgi:putative membrane protein